MKLALVLVAVVLVVNVEGWGWVRRIPLVHIPNPSRWGKREVRETDLAAVLSDDELKSRLGVADENLTEVYEVYDVNEDGVITVAEFEAVSSILENMQGEEEGQ
ncbi:hypothetical protein LOTGIDRAFT_157695 [Lottia gigantea]|uniref:EF-hand domain-containing protein n=1 Tax=Lottia gigantea TaxID=225164 RepID=V4AT88_LOTGI|nr:hypothetical protein LOTGIDRAFT_157695 [Lottia gigantea]ESP00488.1 hypothetical protein LOTGIDRAFT_157695 [Lottia gigantea]